MKRKDIANVDITNKEMLETIDKILVILYEAPLQPCQKRAVASAINAMTQEINAGF